jgi:hypothetical protein
VPRSREVRGGETAARWVLVVTASVVLLAVGALAVAIVELSACGGDGGSPHAEPGSPQRDYCGANFQLIALLSPLPLIIGAVVSDTRGGGKRLAILFLVGLVVAGSPVLAALILPDG